MCDSSVNERARGRGLLGLAYGYRWFRWVFVVHLPSFPSHLCVVVFSSLLPSFPHITSQSPLWFISRGGGGGWDEAKRAGEHERQGREGHWYGGGE